MVSKNTGKYGFLGTSWVLITYNICPPVLSLVIDLLQVCIYGGT